MCGHPHTDIRQLSIANIICCVNAKTPMLETPFRPIFGSFDLQHECVLPFLPFRQSYLEAFVRILPGKGLL